MFDKNFYPTPEHLIEYILKNAIDKIDAKTKILEPSAGSGAFLDYICKRKYVSSGYYQHEKEFPKQNLFCIEKSPELQAILRDKGYRLLGDDFIEYKADRIYDYIIMNPPFDNGAKHLLKALEIAKGAEIFCLLNAETVRNPYSAERKTLLNILENENAHIEFTGQSFKDAERKTDVEVAFIRVKPQYKREAFYFDVSETQERQYTIEDAQSGQIAPYDVFQSLEARYNAMCEATARRIKLDQELEYLGGDIMNKDRNPSKLPEDKVRRQREEAARHQYGERVDEIREKFWDYVLRNTTISDTITKKAREAFELQQKEQGAMPFTARNIENLLYTLIDNRGELMQQCVEESFDLMTKYYKGNREEKEGWKSNNQWFVSRKVVLPNVIRDLHERPAINYYYGDTIDDIEKGVAFVAGKKFTESNTITEMLRKDKLDFGKLYESDFFQFRCYKKGTIHLFFKDEYVWNQFNIIACKCKNWIKSA